MRIAMSFFGRARQERVGKNGLEDGAGGARWAGGVSGAEAPGAVCRGRGRGRRPARACVWAGACVCVIYALYNVGKCFIVSVSFSPLGVKVSMNGFWMVYLCRALGGFC